MMPPSTQSLISIQKAGAAVFEADAELKIATKAYAERVAAAVALNAFNVGNDHLFENWKSLARAAQTMADIEAELRKVYSVVSELLAEEPQAIGQTAAQGWGRCLRRTTGPGWKRLDQTHRQREL